MQIFAVGMVYYFTLPLIYFISVLPFPALYLLSDCCYLLLYHVIGYRKKVVRQNLNNSFPDKSNAELRRIERSFYHYLCDLILETFKTLTISRSTALRRCTFSEETRKRFVQLEKEGKSCIIVMGHFGNWEWAGNTFSLLCPQPLYVIYHPIKNPHFEKLVYGMRSRFGTRLYALKDTVRDMMKNKTEVNATAFIADQAPSPDNACWTRFLNQDTPVFRGPEIIAKKFNFPVVYVTVNRKSRGYYRVESELLSSHPQDTVEGEITARHTRKLEQDINDQPEIWLWSHRRWKHRKPGGG